MATTEEEASRPQVVVVTGASSGFGAMTARAVAGDGHVVYAGIRETEGKNASTVANLNSDASAAGISLKAVEMDVQSQESVDAAIATVLAEQGRLDALVHNAGHMVLGPAEAFTPEQLAEIYDVNVIGTQRVNRAAVPHLREQGHGYLIWVGSSSHRGGCPPFLGPYFAAKAGLDALAVSYAGEVIRFGIDTTIVVPGSFTSGTNHFAHAGTPNSQDVADAYDEKYAGLMDDVSQRLADLEPKDADPSEVGRTIARLIQMPGRSRPFRVHIDPSKDGCEVVATVADRIHAEFYRRVGIEDLLPANANR